MRYLLPTKAGRLKMEHRGLEMVALVHSPAVILNLQFMILNVVSDATL